MYKRQSSNKVKEVEARDLKKGDILVIPKKLPSAGDIKEINILDYMNWKDFRKKWLYVYGVNKNVFDVLLSKAKRIHKKIDKRRAFYRFYNDEQVLDISEDALRFCIKRKYLPLYLVLFTGINELVKNCVIRSYYHGIKTNIPVTWELTPSLARFLGFFVSEGHIDVRQIGFTFGKHEDIYIEEISRTARTLGANITIEQREKSIRVKVFGSILAYLMEKWCGRGARNKRVPEFIFRTTEELRQHFLDALYQGDGHCVRGRNCLMLNTVSKQLANDVMYLWSMQGVVSSLYTNRGKGLGKKPCIGYVVSIYGNNINRSHVFKPKRPVKPNITQNNLVQLSITDSDLAFVRVKEIEIIDSGHEYVYDFAVPECENFVGGFGGIACHNSRGQQGLGISVAVLYSQLTTGMPTEVISSVGDGKIHKYTLKIDVKKNEPVILSDEVIDGDSWHGVQVTFVCEGVYKEHKQSVLEYLKETSISNPYANITFESPKGKVEFKRAVDELPKEPKEIKPHLHGVEVGILSRMLHETKARTLQSFFTKEFSRVGNTTAKEICEKAGIDPRTSPRKVTDDQVREIIKIIKEVKLTRPPTDCLSPLGTHLIKEGLIKELNPEFVAAVTRPPEVYRGWPFVVEVGIAYGGSIEEPQIMRFANRVPLLYQQGDCAITKAIQNVDWKRYKIEADKLPKEPMVIFVHIASVWVPFTSESKEAVASYPVILKEVKLAVQEVARRLSIYLSGLRRAKWQAERKSIFERYANETANALHVLTNAPTEEIVAKIKTIIEKNIGDMKMEEVIKNETKEGGNINADGEVDSQGEA